MESYQKIQQPYKQEVTDIWDGHVIIEEKIDGSQFRIEISPDGTIKCGSHKQEGEMIASDFLLGVEQANHIFAGYKPEVKTTVFCEYLKTPSQNAIPYERVPLHNLMLFDVKRGDVYLDRPQKELFAKQHGMEITPLLWEGDGSKISKDGKIDPEFAKQLLEKKSILGHGKGFDRIEGVVVKNYSKYYDVNKQPYLEGHWKCIKIVNDEFKEKNREENPNRASKLQELKENYRSEARYRKAIQHAREQGLIKGEMADLKYLVPMVEKDIVEEEKEEIKETLWKMFGKEILGYASKGMPIYYKEYLANQH